ncbi:MAG TPA: alanine racemase [Acidimicrobiia bacterium]
MRPTYARIDLSAIRHNVEVLRSLIAPAEYCAVVKADGYGHGDVPVATAALEAGATRLAVALVEEGIRLRESGVTAPILVLSEPPPAAAAELWQWDLTPSVYTEAFAQALGPGGKGRRVHINVDTGMHRVGVAPEKLGALLGVVGAVGLEIEGIFTHFPVADSNRSFTMGQVEAFQAIVDGLDVPLAHMANTPGAILFPGARADFARIGLGTYGLHPCSATRDIVDLQPAMSVISAVSFVQRLPAGTRLSYGRTRELEKDSTVVTVPIGYADGFWRLLSNSGKALVGGEFCPLAGTVTMDQTMFVVGDADVAIGDEVVLIGVQGEGSVSADDWADDIGTISYEIVCSVGPRVPRKFVS